MDRSFWAIWIVLSLAGCKGNKIRVEEPDVESLRQEVKPIEVETAVAQLRSFEYLINSSGVIESEKELKIAFQSGGYLENLSVSNGTIVKQGEVVGRLNNDQQELNVEKAQIALENAQVKFSSDSIAFGANITATIIRNLKLQSGLTNAQVSIKEAHLNLDNTIVRAPMDGIVAELREKQGNLISTGKELCVIYDPINLFLKAKILETDFKHVKLGLLADIFPIAFKDQSFSARIVEFNPKVDAKGMIEITFKLSETQGLLPGMNANAVIRVPQTKNIIVPRGALVIKSGRPVVFTFENGLSKWNYVEVGLDNGVDLEILSGIENGSQVITSNNLQLGHDAPVSVSAESIDK